MNLTKKSTIIILAIITILFLILFYFLGGKIFKEGFESKDNIVVLNSGVSSGGSKSSNSSMNYDNYDHYSKSSSPTTFYGPDGGTAKIMSSDGYQYISVVGSNGKTTKYIINAPVTAVTDVSGSTSNKDFTNSISSLMASFGKSNFTSPTGESARIFVGKDGQYAIEVTKPDGTIRIYTATNSYTYQGDQTSTSTASATASASSTSPLTPSVPANNNLNGSTYDSVFPPGVSKSMIPPGQENLYILKSQIVPPVCPSQCANSSSSSSVKKCPPCPGCERCKEPDFACKKVPNYGDSNSDENSFGGWVRDKGSRSNYGSPNGNWGNGGGNGASYGSSNDMNANARSSINSEYLPVPVLSDFSNFGM